MPSAERIPKNPRTVLDSAPGGTAYWEELKSVAVEAGLDEVGVAPAVVLDRALDRIRDRIGRNLVNEMKFTFLRPERSTNVPALVDGARSVIVGVRSYRLSVDDVVGGDGPAASVARYAWVDHYGDLKASLTRVASRLRSDGHRAVVFADDNSVVDREVAWLAGIGWFGKNANILLPGRGSFFVIGCVVTTADLPHATPVEDGCGSCNRCAPACPTGAIIEPGVIDANRCLSWLLQKPGIFPRHLRAALDDRIYGCDDCQTACPITIRGSSGATATQARADAVASVNVLDLLSMDDRELDDVTDRWYVHQRDMTWVRRNLLIVLGNLGNPEHGRTVATIERYARDSHVMLRAHAAWAAARLGLSHVIDELRGGRNGEADEVRRELDDLPPLRHDL